MTMTTGTGMPGHRLDFRLLGPLHGRLDGRELDLGSPQQRAMLAVLLLRPGRPVGTDELTEALWGEAAPDRAVAMLRQYAWRLRTALEPDRPARGTATVLVSVADGYALRVAPETVDAHRFARDLADAARAAATGEPAEAEARLTAALAHWTGSALAGLPGPYAERQRDRLTELRLGAQEDLLDCLLATGRPGQAVAELQSLTARHPLRERPRAQLMLALYRTGRQAEALGLYADTRRLLSAELGVEPGAELAELQSRILAADPGLDGPVPDRPAPLRPAAVPVPVPADRTPRQLTADVADFTGRTAIVRQLADGLRSGPGRALAICTVSGPGGVGKTALATHVAHLVRDGFPDGQLYVDLRGAGRAPADTGTVLARFLQTLGVRESAVPEDLEQRAAHYRSLLAERRVLVVLDNAHDTAQIRPLLPGGGGCAVLVTSRARTILLPGARQFELDVLTEAEAVDLLAAAAAGNGWPPNRRPPANWPPSAAGCRSRCGSPVPGWRPGRDGRWRICSPGCATSAAGWTSCGSATSPSRPPWSSATAPCRPNRPAPSACWPSAICPTCRWTRLPPCSAPTRPQPRHSPKPWWTRACWSRTAPTATGTTTCSGCTRSTGTNAPTR
ncbi:BTAD domain-containing putative transcriptional regulator [Kitasatospora gansuensis]